MKTLHLRPHRTAPTRATTTTRRRPESAAIRVTAYPCPGPQAGHDFLVPNPRPDLTTDVQTLRMLAGAR